MQKDVELVGKTVRLRPYRGEDAAEDCEAARESFREVGEFLAWCHAAYSIEESVAWIKSCGESWGNGSAYEFAVLDAGNNRYLGGCYLNHINNGMGSPIWGTGYAAVQPEAVLPPNRRFWLPVSRSRN